MNQPFYGRLRRLLAALLCPALLLCIAAKANAVPEAEPNNSLASAQVLAPGELLVEGGGLNSLLPGSPFLSRNGTLASGVVDSFDFSVTPGAPFTAIIDNLPDGADTTMGALDENSVIISTDDDSSPIGSGVASSLRLNGNSDGTLRLRVSGFSDFDFDGLNDGTATPHGQSGNYSLFVYQGNIGGDVDFYRFTGLTPGQMYIAETFAGADGFAPDTVLGWLDNFGGIVATDDDNGEGTLSQLVLTTPASGTLNIGVSGFSDFGFEGSHGQSGNYALGLRAVPEPSGWLVGTLGLLGMVLMARRKR